MAAAVMQPHLSMSLDREIMAPSPISNNQSRHGRGKHGGSFSNNKKTRQRACSIIAERDATVTRALTKILKRTAVEGEEQEEGKEKLIAGSGGWFHCDNILNNLNTLGISFIELQRIIQSPSSKSRFTLKPTSSSETESESPSDYLIRLNTPSTPRPITPNNLFTTPLELLTSTTTDLPDLIVYETSYANYPLILASGGIKKAGGQTHLSFASIATSTDGTETRTPLSLSTNKDDADISIYISLKATMDSLPHIQWWRNGSGGILSQGDENGMLGKGVWKRVVARRADLGILFEEGVVRKEVPEGLRGKGGRGKKGGKGRGRGNGWGEEIRERSRSGDELEVGEE